MLLAFLSQGPYSCCVPHSHQVIVTFPMSSSPSACIPILSIVQKTCSPATYCFHLPCIAGALVGISSHLQEVNEGLLGLLPRCRRLAIISSGNSNFVCDDNKACNPEDFCSLSMDDSHFQHL